MRLRTSTIVKRKVEQDHIANSTAKDPKEKAEKKPDTGIHVLLISLTKIRNSY